MNGNSLSSRFTLTQLLLVLVFQVFAMAMAMHFVVSPLLKAATKDLVSLIALSTQSWAAQTPAQRQHLANQMARDYGLSVEQASVPLVSAPGLMPYGRLLETALRARFGDTANVRVESVIKPRYVLDIPTQTGRLRISFLHRRLGTNPYLAITLTLLASATLGVAVAMFLARWLTRPLREFSDAAQQIGAGKSPVITLPHGVAELDSLAHAFNQMAQEVQQLLNNRATLLAGVSHDLRTPITGLRMALELAQDRLEPAEFSLMVRNLEKMNLMIEGYLGFVQPSVSRYQQQTGLRNQQAIELLSWLQQLCSAIKTDSPPQVSGKPLSIIADPFALERVVGNLLHNALRYGIPPIEVSLSCTGNLVVIEVSDRGPGIPETERENVFQPFIRLETSRSLQTGGTGLGLAIVRELCRVHGWQASLHGNQAGGTVARLTLTSVCA